MARLTTYLDIESRKILRSGFDFKSNLTSVIGYLANRGFLASYVSRHKAMAYDIATLIWMLAVASVPPADMTSQLDEGILCVFALGKLGYGEVFSSFDERRPA